MKNTYQHKFLKDLLSFGSKKNPDNFYFGEVKDTVKTCYIKKSSNRKRFSKAK